MFISQQYQQNYWNKYFLMAFEDQVFNFYEDRRFDLCFVWESL